ncbi:MAG: alkaline phosphatase family protein [Verrucomicrobiota bacterium]|nr:alkaline phosphatase family protein [Verrucomicrobiota bacterium]
MNRAVVASIFLFVAQSVLSIGHSNGADKKLPTAKAEHVVLIVWDGMRPDFVTEYGTSNLWKLSRGGVIFRRHHSVYPSLTSVNAAALATGVYPDRSGIIANWAFPPDISGGKLTRLDAPETISKGDEVTGGKYLTVPTIAELVQARGGRVAIAGTKTAPLLQNRHATAPSASLFGGETIPKEALAKIVKMLGPFPVADELPNVAQDAWTTRALTEVLWGEGVPDLSVLWMSDPDRSQHATEPGSPTSLAAIKSVDANLGVVVHALTEKGVLDRTDILLASDHGFSTIERSVDVAAFLRTKDFDVAGPTESELPRGRIKVAGNGGTNLYYIGEHDPAVAERLVRVLQQTDFTGVIFARPEVEGAFPLALAHVQTDSGPDVVMTFRWNNGRNEHGVAGMIIANGSGDPAKATHGTLSPFDLHNTFIAAGPDFASGLESDVPTSNLDVAATIARLVGVNSPQPFDGRVVVEGMSADKGNAGTVEQHTLEASRDLPGGEWHQYLRTSRVGTSLYFDEGNGAIRQTQKPPQ